MTFLNVSRRAALKGLIAIGVLIASAAWLAIMVEMFYRLFAWLDAHY